MTWSRGSVIPTRLLAPPYSLTLLSFLTPRISPSPGGPSLPSSIQTSPFTFLKVLFPPALVSRSAPLLHWESRASGGALRGGSLSSPLLARTEEHTTELPSNVKIP